MGDSKKSSKYAYAREKRDSLHKNIDNRLGTNKLEKKKIVKRKKDKKDEMPTQCEKCKFKKCWCWIRLRRFFGQNFKCYSRVEI